MYPARVPLFFLRRDLLNREWAMKTVEWPVNPEMDLDEGNIVCVVVCSVCDAELDAVVQIKSAYNHTDPQPHIIVEPCRECERKRH